MSSEICLRYKRTGESYEGSITIDGVESSRFSNYTFAQKMREVHMLLVNSPKAVVSFVRTDSPNLQPVMLDSVMSELLRTDPTSYIAAHTIPHRTVNLHASNQRKSPLAQRHVVPPGVRSGHATLVDTFGDVVYLEWRGGKVEHPVTGRWVERYKLEIDAGLQILESIQPEGVNPGWVTVRMDDLLRLRDGNATGYYLPRAWNDKGPWISRADLLTKYEQFRKERATCLEKAQTT